MRTLILTFGLLVAATPLAAQQHDEHASDAFPAEWQVRLDRADASTDDVQFIPIPGGSYRATLGPAAIFYNPEHTATGDYRAHATFSQMQAPEHPEAYGLFVGGTNLDADAQDYLYFLVRQDGSFLVKHRAGEETHTLVDWTEHPAIARADADGKATNTLAIDASEHGVRFLVNGTEVADLERVPYMNTDGIVGFRINHNLDVQVSDFGIEQAGDDEE